ncbi:Carboxylesterase 5A [Chamberlinius hualienensis]
MFSLLLQLTGRKMFVFQVVSAITLICAHFLTISATENPIVTINSGQVKGYVDNSIKGQPFYGFKGIPYVKPPDRFKVAEPVEKWSGVLDATKEGAICAQWNFTNEDFGSEDCLTINVYTPKLGNEADDLLPVIFVIHGGGFIRGTGGDIFIKPHNLMDYPIVLIAINYRLGVLGFLNTEDKNSPGNYGLMDQVMALKWVQENIKHFNGDPNNVAIFGTSAGGASVIYHVLSPLSKGLFHRAFASSGTSINHWAFQRQPLKYAKLVAAHLKCVQPNISREIVKCLSEKSAFEINRAADELPLAFLFPNDPVPSVEPNGSGFLPDSPWNLLNKGELANNVPVILGHNEREGILIYALFLADKKKSNGRSYFENEFPSYLPLFTPVQENVSLAVKEILKSYVNNSVNLDDDDVFNEVITSIIGDAMFTSGIAYTAEKLSSAGLPVYYYLFDYTGKTFSYEYLNGTYGNYTTHEDDALYYFRDETTSTSMSKDDVTMSDVVSTLLTSFAAGKDLKFKNGDEWPTFDKGQYVKLNLKPTVHPGLPINTTELWTKTLPAFTEEHEKSEFQHCF